MRCRLQILIVILPILMMAADAHAIDIRPPKPPAPSGKKIIVRDTITLDRRNTTYDYEGATLIWKGPGDCSQTEDMPPIFRITGNGITVKNATIVGAPDGIHIQAARVTIENISFPDVCEDAITMKDGARWSKVTKCFFAKATDKAIQCSHGSGHRIYDNIFVNVRCALRSKEGVNASFYRNKLHTCKSGVRGDGRGSNTKTWDNTFIFVRQPYERLDNAVIRQIGDDKQVKLPSAD